jgi:hypothetical protein
MRTRKSMRNTFIFWHPWYMKIMNWFKYHFVICPACNGDGGHTEHILDDGSGPYEPCGLCARTGEVLNPITRIKYWFYDR